MIVLDRTFTGRDNNEDTRLAYFREDVGINMHHWHWHLIYTADAPRTGPGSRNRKGELFYYMHHSMMARYWFSTISSNLYVISYSTSITGHYSDTMQNVYAIEWASSLV